MNKRGRDRAPRRAPGPLDGFHDRARRELYPLLRDSALYVGFDWGAGRAPDPQRCMELGMSIVMDKPIVFALERGQALPERLRRLADAVIDDVDLSTEDGRADCQRRIGEAMDRLGLL